MGPASGIVNNILVPSLTFTRHVYAVVPLLGIVSIFQISPPGIKPTMCAGGVYVDCHVMSRFEHWAGFSVEV
jgi:hypothetical protein